MNLIQNTERERAQYEQNAQRHEIKLLYGNFGNIPLKNPDVTFVCVRILNSHSTFGMCEIGR